MNTLNKILALLEQKKIEQQEFAVQLGLHKRTITDWKNGKSKSYLKYIDKIAAYFNVSTDYLLGNTDDPSPSGVEPEKSESVRWENIRVTFYEGGEGEDLSDEEKEEILDLVKFARERRRKKREEKNSKER